MADSDFRVWIGCLACYNGGDLVGQWYDADEAGEVTTEDLHEAEAQRRGTANVGQDYSHHEELWVMDLDNAPRGVDGEMSPADAQAIADRLRDLERQHIDPDAYGAYGQNQGYDFADDYVGEFEEAFCGGWDSREDYAQELAEELGAVPKDYSWPASYIDWERATRDLFMDYWSEDIPTGGVWVFRSI